MQLECGPKVSRNEIEFCEKNLIDVSKRKIQFRKIIYVTHSGPQMNVVLRQCEKLVN